jgi:hypothetical protein
VQQLQPKAGDGLSDRGGRMVGQRLQSGGGMIEFALADRRVDIRQGPDRDLQLGDPTGERRVALRRRNLGEGTDSFGNVAGLEETLRLDESAQGVRL